MNQSKRLTCRTNSDVVKLIPDSILLETYIGDHWENSNHVEDLVPCADAVRFGRHGPAELSGVFPGVHSHFQDIIHQSQQRSQRERGHKQGDEAKLDNCKTKWDFYELQHHLSVRLSYCRLNAYS